MRFAIAFGLVYFVIYGRAFWQAKNLRVTVPFWCFVLGGLSYVPVYLVLHVVLWGSGELTSVGESLVAYYQLEASLSGNASFSERVLIGMQDWTENYLLLHPLELGLLVAGAGAVLWRRFAADRILLFIFGLSLLVFFVLQAHHNNAYWIQNLPFVAIFGGALLAQVGQTLQIQHRLTTIGMSLGIGVLLAANISYYSES